MMNIKTSTIITAILILLSSSCCLSNNKDVSKPSRPVDYVNPLIGSVHSRWFFMTPAALPFGMARLGPHTDGHYGNRSGWEAVGYDYRHSSIEGFGNLHEFQIGGVVLMPTTGKIVTTPGRVEYPDAGYRSRYDKASQLTTPGYYSVQLTDYDIKAELTATQRVGFHRYTFPKTDKAHIIVDCARHQGESGKVLDSHTVLLKGDTIVEGWVTTYPEYVKNWMPDGSVTLYYVMQFSQKPVTSGSFTGDVYYELQREIGGKESGLVLTFDTNTEQQIEVQVGLSYTSVENARANLAAEYKNESFDTMKTRAVETWNNHLSRILVSGESEENKVKFYTALWHALSGRGLASDANGTYPRFDGTIGQIPLDKQGNPRYSHYNSDATWGSCWNLMQLWSIAYPEYLSSFINAHLDYYDDCGWLPDGVAAGRFVPGVPSNFLGLMISMAYARGIRDFDVEKAFEAAYKNETSWEGRLSGVGKYDLRDFVERGYIPHEVTVLDMFHFGGSHTLEYAFSSWAVGQMALSLGKTKEYEQLNLQGTYYRNVYDPEVKFMRSRNQDGTFLKDFSPEKAWQGFQEGNSWQYSWYVPQDVAGLIDLLGHDLFVNRLDSIFTQSEKNYFGGGQVIDAFSGLSSVYNHGNQPNLHISYLFNYVGKPWLTQKWVRKICDIFYGTTSTHGYGYGQDEDQGQLGAWYVLAAMGLFDVQGGANINPTLQLSTPLFNEIKIELNPQYGAGESFEIITDKSSDTFGYIHSATLNGKKLNAPWFFQSELFKGGRLKLKLGDEPNKIWGTDARLAPPSLSNAN